MAAIVIGSLMVQFQTPTKVVFFFLYKNLGSGSEEMEYTLACLPYGMKWSILNSGIRYQRILKNKWWQVN